jgi:hypothetical protein
MVRLYEICLLPCYSYCLIGLYKRTHQPVGSATTTNTLFWERAPNLPPVTIENGTTTVKEDILASQAQPCKHYTCHLQLQLSRHNWAFSFFALLDTPLQPCTTYYVYMIGHLCCYENIFKCTIARSNCNIVLQSAILRLFFINR